MNKNKFIIIKSDSHYGLEDKVNEFLRDKYKIQIISHSFGIEEITSIKSRYFCTIIYKI